MPKNFMPTQMMYAPHITRSPSKALPETDAPTIRPTTVIKDMVRRRQIIVKNTPNNNTRMTGALAKAKSTPRLNM